MTRDDIIRLAVEAKLVCHWDGGCASAWVEGHDLTPYLERFAALVAAAEREACAKVCENLAKDRGMFHPDDEDFKNGVLAGAGMCAVTIRMRGKK
jgi:hypothetical protein